MKICSFDALYLVHVRRICVSPVASYYQISAVIPYVTIVSKVLMFELVEGTHREAQTSIAGRVLYG
jgi:hypothetical protein